MLVLIRGAGDLATGIALRLFRSHLRVVMTDLPQPTAIRRTVCFSQAILYGSYQVEDVTAERAETEDDVRRILSAGQIPVLADPRAVCRAWLRPDVVVDAILAKKNLGTAITDAPLVIGVGPGFCAGKDCHAVIETMRGHNLGRIIKKGIALPNTGVPGLIAGIGKERVIHSPAAGNMKNICQIADLVEKDQVIAMVGDTPVKATISGMIRGLIRDGYPVFEGMKIADIDPRAEQKKNCFTISDKARCIAGGVLEVLLSCGVLPGTEKAVRNENL